ncbi:hypothetical protein L1049_016745 [Liquidambar formosana]|uniref:Uncharacterized protein n=1 Tax=Liquidambar formosana TaxID=63359 RepID=A0AAP0X0T4_LIQFO
MERTTSTIITTMTNSFMWKGILDANKNSSLLTALLVLLLISLPSSEAFLSWAFREKTITIYNHAPNVISLTCEDYFSTKKSSLKVGEKFVFKVRAILFMDSYVCKIAGAVSGRFDAYRSVYDCNYGKRIDELETRVIQGPIMLAHSILNAQQAFNYMSWVQHQWAGGQFRKMKKKKKVRDDRRQRRVHPNMSGTTWWLLIGGPENVGTLPGHNICAFDWGAPSGVDAAFF